MNSSVSPSPAASGPPRAPIRARARRRADRDDAPALRLARVDGSSRLRDRDTTRCACGARRGPRRAPAGRCRRRRAGSARGATPRRASARASPRRSAARRSARRPRRARARRRSGSAPRPPARRVRDVGRQRHWPWRSSRASTSLANSRRSKLAIALDPSRSCSPSNSSLPASADGGAHQRERSAAASTRSTMTSTAAARLAPGEARLDDAGVVQHHHVSAAQRRRPVGPRAVRLPPPRAPRPANRPARAGGGGGGGGRS